MRSWQPFTAKETASRVIGWLPDVVNCPCDQELLEKALEGSENYLLGDVAWLATTPATLEGSSCSTLDLAVRPDAQGKWLTRTALKEAAEIIFRDRDYVILESRVPKAIKLALRLGANPIRIAGKKDTYLLSAKAFNGSFH